AQTYADLGAIPDQPYTYAVSAVGRLHHESGLSNEMAGKAESSKYMAIELSGMQQMTVSQTQRIQVYGILPSGDKEEIAAGVSFTSSKPATASISAEGVVTALAEGSTLITAEYQGHSASYTVSVQAISTTNPGTQPPPTGTDTSTTSPTLPPTAVLEQLIVSERDLDGIKDGKLEIQLSPAQTQLVLPSIAPVRLGKDGVLNIRAGQAMLSIPSSILEEAEKLMAGAGPNEPKLIIDIKPLATKDASDTLQRLQQHENAVLTANGMIQIGVSAQTKDGRSTALQHFSNGMMLTLNIPGGAKPARTGIYRITAGGSMEYAGGTNANGKQMTVRITLPGQYSAISYDKTFKDIAPDHWASEVIKDMAARHVLQGLPDGSFAPGKAVTRAEFASMLSRLLNLPAKEGSVFTDVKEGSWYARDISAAVEAGIIKGTGEGRFHPDQAVTREEMATMLMHAYQAAGGKKRQADTEISFRDQAGISPWAMDAVNEAAAMGLVQ
ncbi:S-layer homology domain-containing protein, partial [Streptomyces sp. NPDC056154]|uniref:S-layer homology domain-containing protein n=1 Tax=Streptomyces sp. NPDC056154 TaxID=3345729 RepID=UPI0035D90E9A